MSLLNSTGSKFMFERKPVGRSIRQVAAGSLLAVGVFNAEAGEAGHDGLLASGGPSLYSRDGHSNCTASAESICLIHCIQPPLGRGDLLYDLLSSENQ